MRLANQLIAKLRRFRAAQAGAAAVEFALIMLPLLLIVFGIIGYGSIGREVARLATAAFDMQVLACKRDPSSHADTGYAQPGTGDPADTVDPDARRGMAGGVLTFFAVAAMTSRFSYHSGRRMRPEPFLTTG